MGALRLLSMLRIIGILQRFLRFLKPLAECKQQNEELETKVDILVEGNNSLTEKNTSLRRQLTDCQVTGAGLSTRVDILLAKVATLQDAAKPIPAPTVSKWVDGPGIRRIAKAAVPDSRIYMSDVRQYGLIADEEMARFLREDKTNLERYIVEKYDCDDFTWRLLGALSEGPWASIAAGFAWSNTHAFNVYINDKEQLMVIEPQTDKIMPYASDMPGQYIPIFLLMI